MTLLKHLPAALLTAAVMAALVMASHAPLTSRASADAVLRLAWSARPERIETCRAQTEAELAKLPQHMRQPVVCEGTTARYRLTVLHEGRMVADRLVHAGGLRQDRRLYVLEEMPLPVGETLVEVRFDRVDVNQASLPVSTTSPPPGRQADHLQRGETVPPHLAFAERLRVAPLTVVLVTYDPERRHLIRVTGGQ
jgi:hypothetical protein